MASKARKSVLQPITSPDKDPYMKESSKHFKKCQQTHTLQSLDLARKTKDIDVEEKLCIEKHRKETREVRADLHRLSKAKVVAKLERKTWGDKLFGDNSDEEDARFTNPYPIIFPGKENKTQMKGRRGRRMSAEFEDLDFNRVTGMLQAPNSRSRRGHSGALPPVASPRTRKMRPQLPANKECYWVGEPEAISSVRRSKKGVAEQQQQLLLHRSTKSADRHNRRAGVSHVVEVERRYFDDQPEAGMPHRIRFLDPTGTDSHGPSGARAGGGGFGRRRSLSDPEPLDLDHLERVSGSESRLSGISEASASSKGSMSKGRKSPRSQNSTKRRQVAFGKVTTAVIP